MEKNVIVSVIMISYNHKKYICQAIDSVLSQQTNFDYEIIVGDDASTDGTRELLISKYKKCNRIRLFLRSKNIGATRNSYNLCMHAKGKYLCIAEGDDYWTDVNYLQTMVDWLESHDGYTSVVARRVTLSERTGHKTLMVASGDCNCDILLEDFLKGYKMFELCACMFINFFHDGEGDYRLYKMSRHMGDLTMAIYILHHGKSFQLDNIIGVYRIDRNKGASNYNSIIGKKEIFFDHINILAYMKKFCYPKLDYSYLQSCYAFDFLGSAQSVVDLIENIVMIVGRINFKALRMLLIRICH